jgi:hypothetical protein
MYLVCPNCGLMREARLPTAHTCGRCRARGDTVHLTVLPSMHPLDQRSPTVDRNGALARAAAPRPHA